MATRSIERRVVSHTASALPASTLPLPTLPDTDLYAITASLLGGLDIPAGAIRSPYDIHDALMKGLPGSALQTLLSQLRVLPKSGKRLENAMGVSLRTMQRKKGDAANRLNTEQAGRTWQFAELLARATKILGSQEAAERGFDDLDAVPRVLTSLLILDPALHVVHPADVPNPNWLRPGRPTTNQQQFGDRLLAAHGLVVIPSAVSSHSWNVVFLAGEAARYRFQAQERFALDTRLAS